MFRHLSPSLPSSVSSPRARGTLQAAPRSLVRIRFIPAHAGNINRSTKIYIRSAVHPRTRGEHAVSHSPPEPSHGSSPHTRGTFQSARSFFREDRFIPAHAGNITSRARRPGVNPVHPRTRGEHIYTLKMNASKFGSSPHTRGISTNPLLTAQNIRFIPAHAGNILMSCPKYQAPPVHPRTRGEHATLDILDRILGGSSPHTRGTYQGAHDGVYRHRFIPAHAGNMSPGRSGTTRKTVHPRTRGEHSRSNGKSKLPPGSSPHTRGTCHKRVCWLYEQRFIPAHAGKHIQP